MTLRDIQTRLMREAEGASWFRRQFVCRFGLCGMVPRDDDTHLWGECLRCGRRAGLVSRRAVRAYIEAEERQKAFAIKQTADLAGKPALLAREESDG